VWHGAPSILDDGHLRISSSSFVSRVQASCLSSTFAAEGPEMFVFTISGGGSKGHGAVGCRSISSSWRLTTAAVGGRGEILVGISRRTVEGLFFCELLPRVPTFEANDSPRDREGIEVHVLMCWHQGGVAAVVEIAMVLMTFRRGPTGFTRGRSTGKKLFLLVVQVSLPL